MSQRHYLLSPVAVTQAGGGSSVPTLLCSKKQASENSTGQRASKFSSRLRRGFLGTSFPLLFPLFLPLFLPGCEPDQNPGYPAQALRSYCKNSVRDSDKWEVNLLGFREKRPFYRVLEDPQKAEA